MLLPQTIGPFNDRKTRNKAIKTINKCDVVLARDKQSYDFLKENTAQKNIDEIIDVAFFMPYKKKHFSKDFIHAGVNISALLWHGGYTRDNQFGLKDDYRVLVRRIIDYLLAIPSIKIHIVAHVVDNTYNVENDYAVSYHLTEEYNNENIVLAPLFLSPILAKNYIAGLDFFAGARMHAAIAAFSSGVPVYPMAYSRKFNGLFLDTLTYPYMGDMKTQDNDEILAEIKNAFSKRDELKNIIQDRMNGVVAEREELLKKHLIEFLQLK
jgi:polysaccharide pyruvyl transferase WcaK-like protein